MAADRMVTVWKLGGKHVYCLIWLLIWKINASFAEADVASDIHQSPHSTLHLFIHRKANYFDRLTSGAGPCSGDNQYQVTISPLRL